MRKRVRSKLMGQIARLQRENWELKQRLMAATDGYKVTSITSPARTGNALDLIFDITVEEDGNSDPIKWFEEYQKTNPPPIIIKVR